MSVGSFKTLKTWRGCCTVINLPDLHSWNVRAPFSTFRYFCNSFCRVHVCLINHLWLCNTAAADQTVPGMSEIPFRLIRLVYKGISPVSNRTDDGFYVTSFISDFLSSFFVIWTLSRFARLRQSIHLCNYFSRQNINW